MLSPYFLTLVFANTFFFFDHVLVSFNCCSIRVTLLHGIPHRKLLSNISDQESLHDSAISQSISINTRLTQ